MKLSRQDIGVVILFTLIFLALLDRTLPTGVDTSTRMFFLVLFTPGFSLLMNFYYNLSQRYNVLSPKYDNSSEEASIKYALSILAVFPLGLLCMIPLGLFYFQLSQLAILSALLQDMIVVFIILTYANSQDRIDSAASRQRRVKSKTIDVEDFTQGGSVEKLDLSNRGITEIDLSPLGNCLSLRSLNLGFNKLRAIDLSPLSTCTQLEDIMLDDNQLESIDLTPLADCQNLTGLGLFENRLEFIDLEPLKNCKNFRELGLDFNPVAHLNLEPLRSLRKFELLSISGLPVSKIDLTPLKGLKKLHFLTLAYMGLDELDLAPLAGCINLDYLSIESNNLRTLDTTPLVSCKKLDTFVTDPVIFYIAQEVQEAELPKALRKIRRRIKRI